MSSSEIDLHGPLKTFFGFSKFKGLQKEVVLSVLKDQNTFVIMPTGGGKSMCYQLPALMKEGLAIVISPLIALMKNQVDAIRGISEHDGIAHVLNSFLNKEEIATVKSDIVSGLTKLLYVAPESLVKEEYFTFLQKQKISFVAIDEAHCISEWGHDFRPEYRNLKSIIKNIDNLPIIALTATATEKVQEDILKILDISDVKTFKASFNRPNLFYEVRPKTREIYSDIIRFIKGYQGKSGIIYCLSRKKVEEVAQILQVNGIKSLPYHAGLNAKTRSKHQDMFLMEDIDVIVATVAFGMGIDKQDIRFVIHHDMPKSIESYYQETGRAGRDDGEGYCLAYYSYKDIEKLEKFMANKPIAEQEIGHALLQEVVGYAETTMSRRKYLLHYFGEGFDEVKGLGADMDDNTRNPKSKSEARENVKILFEVIRDTKEKYKPEYIVSIIIGKNNAVLTPNKTHKLNFFGIGKEKDKSYWMALIRQTFVTNFIRKDIEQYGVLKLTEKGIDFIANPVSFMMTSDHVYSEEFQETGAGVVISKDTSSINDQKLFTLLKGLRKKISKERAIPPPAIFQIASLKAMTLKYPISLEELSNVHGVGIGKAKKFGKDFIELIEKYVDENDITRPDDLILKGTGNKSRLKLYIIQNIDRKLPLEDISKSKGLEMSELIKEIETIVHSGTKLDISYCINDVLDNDQQGEIMEYFMELETDDIQAVLDEFGGIYEEEYLRLMRIKFLSDVGN